MSKAKKITINDEKTIEKFNGSLQGFFWADIRYLIKILGEPIFVEDIGNKTNLSKWFLEFPTGEMVHIYQRGYSDFLWRIGASDKNGASKLGEYLGTEIFYLEENLFLLK